MTLHFHPTCRSAPGGRMSGRRSGRSIILIACDRLAERLTTYRKHNKPALGPLGDSLDDLGGHYEAPST